MTFEDKLQQTLEAVMNNGALYNDDIPITLVPPMSVPEAKQSITDAVLEEIGEDETEKISYPPKGFSNIRYNLSKPRNDLRAELRNKFKGGTK